MHPHIIRKVYTGRPEKIGRQHTRTAVYWYACVTENVDQMHLSPAFIGSQCSVALLSRLYVDHNP